MSSANFRFRSIANMWAPGSELRESREGEGATMRPIAIVAGQQSYPAVAPARHICLIRFLGEEGHDL